MRPDGEVIAAKARELLKPRVRFLPYGRSPGYGMDCVGVPIWVARELGIWPQIMLPPYSFPPSQELFESIFPQYADEVEAPAVGDIVVIKNEHGKPHHVGIVVQSRHSEQLRLVGIGLSNNARFVAEFNYSPDLVARTWKVYRYRDVQD